MAEAGATAETIQRPRDAAYAHAVALMTMHPLIDAHNDMPWTVRNHGGSDLERYDLTKVHPETDTDIPRLRAGKVATQVLAAFLPTKIAHPATVTAEQIDLILRIEEKHADSFHPVRRPADVAEAHRLGKIGSLPSVEGTVGLEGSLAPLRLWQRLGVRLVTLCHNETLPWIDSATDKPDGSHGGLSAFGADIIGEMNRLGLIVDLAHRESIHLRIGQAVLALVILAIFRQFRELALPGGVVHERHDAHMRVPGQRVEHVRHAFGGEFAAQVQQMLCPQQAALARHVDGLQHVLQLFGAIAARLHLAQRQRVEHGGDAGGGDLRVVRQHRGQTGPLHAGAGIEMLLQIVGVQFHQSGQQPVLLPVLRAAH